LERERKKRKRKKKKNKVGAAKEEGFCQRAVLVGSSMLMKIVARALYDCGTIGEILLGS